MEAITITFNPSRLKPGNFSMSSVPTAPNRIVSIDAFRGLVMFLMLAEVLHIASVAKNFPESELWQTLKFHTSHVEWAGCSLHDLIQPSFSFLVGVSLPFSIASRLGRGQTFGRLLLHAMMRSIWLIALGIFLRSTHRQMTYFTFEDTLTQIGLGYTFLFLIGWTRRAWVPWAAIAGLLVGYWIAFAVYPMPPDGFDRTMFNVKADWPHDADGLMAHWNKNTNLAAAFDHWFLNLFPRESAWTYHPGGYATLSFIPTLATMLLGLVAGQWMQAGYPARGLLTRLAMASACCFALSVGLEAAGICPIVKRIWTPAWTLYSGGWCFAILWSFVILFDLLPLRVLAFPFVVIGANSIFIYTIAHLIEPFVKSSFHIHLATLQHWNLLPEIAKEYKPLLEGAGVLVVYWLILYFMYRKRWFIKL
jgi:predicted acyltransferase